MARTLALLFYITLLSLYNINAQVFQAGTITFKVLQKTPQSIIVRMFHKYAQRVPTAELAKCDGNCIDNGLIEGDNIVVNPNGTTNTSYIKRVDTSFYCDLAVRNDSIVVGSRETDLVMERRFTTYDATYTTSPNGCCDSGILGRWTLIHTVTPFRALGILKNRTDKIDAVNNVPDTRFTPLYVEFKNGIVNEHVINIYDLDNDFIRCDWVSDICTAEPCAAKYIKGGFTLYPNCTLRTTNAIAIGYYSLGIAVRDFYINATNYNSPLSQLPFYMLVKVSANDNKTMEQSECPSNRVKPIQDQLVSSAKKFTFSICSFSIFIFTILFKF